MCHPFNAIVLVCRSIVNQHQVMPKESVQVRRRAEQQIPIFFFFRFVNSEYTVEQHFDHIYFHFSPQRLCI
jgi:hypothetical protein